MAEITRYSRNVYVVKRLLSSHMCDELINVSETHGFVEAPITTRSGPVMDKSVRNNHRVIVDSQNMTDLLWEAVQPYVEAQWRGKDVLGLNERLRFYRYDPSEKFDWHCDGCYQRESGERSQFTLMFYLNDQFEGGTTDFGEFSVVPSKGDALLFWHHQIHRGAAIVSGRKYVVRTDVMYAK